jgi:sigma-B regulation protein RsbU (phosphoserine phosphatase)
MSKLLQCIKIYRHLVAPSVFLILAIPLLAFARFFEAPFDRIFDAPTYLAWHNLFEMSFVVGFIAIFLITYHTYSRTARLKTILIGNMLLIVGILHALHMLTFEGMPAFFTAPDANRSATYWILARSFFVLTFLVTANIHPNIQCKRNRDYFLAASLVVAGGIFIVVTRFPAVLPAMYTDGEGLTPVKTAAECVISLLLLVCSGMYFRNGIRLKDKMLQVFACALAMGALSEISFVLYVNVYGIYDYIGHALGILAMYMAVRNAIARNVLEPFFALEEAQGALKEHSANQDGMIEQRTRQLRAMNSRLMEDLEYARGIQKALLPVFLPDNEEIAVNAVYIATERISGDFYDVFRIGDRYKGFYISDVSGHGVPAAMLTVFLKQCVDNIVKADMRNNTLTSPADVLQQVYEAFNNSNFSDEVYIILIYCIYDMEEKKLMLSSAGMNAKPLLVESDGTIRELELAGFPVCKLKGVCVPEFADYEIPVKNGDRLYLYTDGLPEARDAGGDMYSSSRLVGLISRSRDRKLVEQQNLITEDLFDFCSGKRMKDDVTLVAVEFRK